HDALGDLVTDDEDQVRLRQEPRLEDPAAVLVGDALLPAVSDGLDDSDADVAGLLLDRLHDGLDAVAHDDGLDLRHGPHLPLPISPVIPLSSSCWTNKKAPGLAGVLRPHCLCVSPS